jgi:hypothetical protein
MCVRMLWFLGVAARVHKAQTHAWECKGFDALICAHFAANVKHLAKHQHKIYTTLHLSLPLSQDVKGKSAHMPRTRLAFKI